LQKTVENRGIECAIQSKVKANLSFAKKQGRIQRGGCRGYSPPSEPDFFIRPRLLSLKSPLISSSSPKSSLFSPPFVPVLHPPLQRRDHVLIYMITNVIRAKQTDLRDLKNAALGDSTSCQLLVLVDLLYK
jgi:hypothetical protein